jgi:hypothetical protein
VNLDTTTKVLQIVLGEAKTTNDCPIVTAYADFSLAAGTFIWGNQNILSDGTTPVIAVAAPDMGFQRQAKEVRLFNADTVQHTVTLQLYDGTDTWIIAPSATAVAPNGAFVYTPDVGISGSDAIVAALKAGITVTPQPSGPTIGWASSSSVYSGTFTFTQFAPSAGTVSSLEAIVGNNGGAITTTVNIDGSPVTGINGVTVNSGTTQSFAATADNAYSEGSVITLVLVIASGAPAGAVFTLLLS